MSEFLIGETAKISQQKLIDKGFNFNYHTNITTTKEGKNYVFCYEYGYLPIEGNYYLLVKNMKIKKPDRSSFQLGNLLLS